MAGLVPAIHAEQYEPMRGGWIYIVTNRPNGTLYIGVTSNLPRRIYENRHPRRSHSTVTLLARLRGWSTSLPMNTAV